MAKIGCIGNSPVEGMRIIEVQFEKSVSLKEAEARSLKKKTGKAVVNVHAPYYGTLASPKRQKVRDATNRILEAVRVGKVLGSKVVVVHPGFYSKQNSEVAFENVKENCKELCKKAKGIEIGMETMGRKSQFGTLDEVLKLAGEVEGIKPVFNFASIHARTNGGLKRKKDFEKILKGVDDPYCHFSGVRYKDGNEIGLVALEKSDFAWQELARAVKDVDATLVCDSPEAVADAYKFKGFFSGI